MFEINPNSTSQTPVSYSHQKRSNFVKELQQSQKRKTLSLLRQLSNCQSLQWQTPYQKFMQTLNNCNNVYSLFVTLFEIAQDPLWRNRVSHLCIIIQKLHNLCVDTYGNYLTQLERIEKYHSKLINIFYLNDPQVQEHFKNLIKIYLNQNSRYGILNEEQVAVGLIDAAKGQKLVKLPEYLWIVGQIKAGDKAVLKVLKIAQDCLNSVESNKVSIILPSLTILGNYIYHENRLSVLEELLNNTMFQNILILSLQTTSSIEISKEALFLCNNILAKSSHLSHKLMSSNTLMNAASMINCEEQLIFQKLTSIRSNQTQLT